MKTCLRLGGVVVAVTVTLASGALAEDAKSEIQSTFVDPDSAEAKSYRDVGDRSIDRLAMTMITDASRAVAGGTEIAALPNCHLKDVPMKDGTVGGLPRITAVKMTASKVRNPENAPDAAEQAALDKVKRAIDLGTPPKILVQRIDLPSGAKEWRVYKPLVTIRQCGTCHARPDEQTPELRTALAAKYPKDEGSGFGVGQWRGLMRVTVADPAPAPAPKPAAPAKAEPPSKGARGKRG